MTATRPNTRRLVDPQLLALLDAWPQVDLTEEMLADVAERRPAADAGADAGGAGRRLERRTVPGPDGAPDV